METEIIQPSIIASAHNGTIHHSHHVGDGDAAVFSRTSLSYFILYCLTGVITLAIGAYSMFLKKNNCHKKQNVMDQVAEPEFSEKHSLVSAENGSEQAAASEIHVSHAEHNDAFEERKALVEQFFVGFICLFWIMTVAGIAFLSRTFLIPYTQPRPDRNAATLTYWLFYGTILLLGAITFRKIPKKEGAKYYMLERDQTDEWKGLMMSGFMLFHMFQQASVEPLIQVYIGCYIFMTGFGNSVFFFSKGDFSFARVFKMVLRINLLVTCLVLAMDDNYVQGYYICPLHTFYFFMAYAVMFPGRAHNKNMPFLFTKICLGFAFCIIVWGIGWDDGFNWMFGWLLNGKALDFWHERTWANHLACMAGIMFAFWKPQIEKYIQSAKETHGKKIVDAVLFALCGAVCAVGVWYLESRNFERLRENDIYMWLSCAVIFCYVMFRNWFKLFRSCFSPVLAFLGRQSLELYCLQWSVWLIKNQELVNGKRATIFRIILPFGPDYFTLSVIATSLIIIALAYVTFKASNHLITKILPSDDVKLFIVGSVSACTFGACYAASYIFA